VISHKGFLDLAEGVEEVNPDNLRQFPADKLLAADRQDTPEELNQIPDNLSEFPGKVTYLPAEKRKAS
jgi:hypothetical protein